MKITVRSPAAVAYLAQAPGELGLARAYVSGHLDVDGDMYEALARMTKAQTVSFDDGRRSCGCCRRSAARTAAAPDRATARRRCTPSRRG